MSVLPSRFFQDDELPTREEIDGALDLLQRAAEDPGYYSVVRGDGSFLQMARLDLEFKRPEWDAPRRGTLPRALNELFQRFAEGDAAWDEGVEWIEELWEPERGWWKSNVSGWVVLFAFALVALLIYVFYL